MRGSETGGIALPSPSTATMLEGGTTIEEPSMKKELACERENAMDVKAEKEKSWEESMNKGFRDVTNRRFMGLADISSRSTVHFLCLPRCTSLSPLCSSLPLRALTYLQPPLRSVPPAPLCSASSQQRDTSTVSCALPVQGLPWS